MQSKPRIRVCCGKEYTYCPHCKEDEEKPTWMFAYDTLECKEIFNALSHYNSNSLTKEEAKDIVYKNLDKNKMFIDYIQKQIDDLLKEEPAKIASKSKPRSKKIVTDN